MKKHLSNNLSPRAPQALKGAARRTPFRGGVSVANVWLLTLFIFSSVNCFSQNPGEWVWLHGDTITNQSGNFGTQGLPSPTNNPPGLYEACEFTDPNGNFWLFGGALPTGRYADLWRYDPLLNEWTWMKGLGILGYAGSFGVLGVPSPTNNPPSLSHGIDSWVDSQGNFWMFGGLVYNGVTSSDLWKYDVSTNEWTWMGRGQGIYGVQGLPSSANSPGRRNECSSSWSDNFGNLWLWGGYSINDLWRYNSATNIWTWMKGDSLPNQIGIYGNIGIEDSSNSPGGRSSYSHWIDSIGNFWLFAGNDFSSAFVAFNDLWKYNPITNNWTWISGSNLANMAGAYGDKCISSNSSVPSARFENRSAWKEQGNFWSWGGFDATVGFFYNDLWKYCVNSNQWIWISGDSIPNQTASWGTLGVSSPTSKPDGRGGSLGWSDNNSLYLFGGLNNHGIYNDLWKFTIDTTCGVCPVIFPNSFFSSQSNSLCPGTCTDFVNLSFNAASYQWSFPGATPDTSTATNPTNICYQNSGSYDVQLIATNTNGSDTLLLSNYITVYPAPAAQGISQSGDTLFANAGANSYQWYYNTNIITGATNYFYIAPSSGDYNVVCTDSNRCEVEAAVFNVIAASPTQPPQRGGVEIHPNPVVDMLEIVSPLFKDKKEIDISIYNILGEKVLAVSPLSLGRGAGGEADVSALPSGMYYLEVTGSGKVFRTKFVKQ